MVCQKGPGVGGGGTYVYLWLAHVDVWQKPTQFCKAIILQLKINKAVSVDYTVVYVEDLNELTKKLLELIKDYSKFVRYKVTTQKSIALLYTSNCQHPLGHRKSKRVPEKHLFLLY